MKYTKSYKQPSLQILLICDDVVRTSQGVEYGASWNSDWDKYFVQNG